MKKKISVKAIQDAVGAPQFEFPKYTTQVINLVNGNAGGTRPKVVGQMSELIQDFHAKLCRNGLSGTMSSNQRR